MSKSAKDNPDLYPFSLILGPGFRNRNGYDLNDTDRAVREKIGKLVIYDNPQAVGRLANILASGEIRFKDIPEIEPHTGHGVTFVDPATLYGRCDQFGEGLAINIRNMLRIAGNSE